MNEKDRALADDTKKMIDFYKLPVEEIMIKELPIIDKAVTIDAVAKLLLVRHHIWVVDRPGSRELVGVITEKDFLNVMSPLPAKSYVVGVIKPKSWHHVEFENAEDIMARHVIKCNPKTTVEDVLILMRRHRLRRIPVTENDEIIGEVTLSALISYASI